MANTQKENLNARQVKIKSDLEFGIVNPLKHNINSKTFSLKINPDDLIIDEQGRLALKNTKEFGTVDGTLDEDLLTSVYGYTKYIIDETSITVDLLSMVPMCVRLGYIDAFTPSIRIYLIAFITRTSLLDATPIIRTFLSAQDIFSAAAVFDHYGNTGYLSEWLSDDDDDKIFDMHYKETGMADYIVNGGNSSAETEITPVTDSSTAVAIGCRLSSGESPVEGVDYANLVISGGVSIGINILTKTKPNFGFSYATPKKDLINDECNFVIYDKTTKKYALATLGTSLDIGGLNVGNVYASLIDAINLLAENAKIDTLTVNDALTIGTLSGILKATNGVIEVGTVVLDDLDDIEITDVQDNDILQYNSASRKWINVIVPGGAETDPIVGAINGLVKANGAGVIGVVVSGTDIKTINSESLLGAGDIVVSGADEKAKVSANDTTAGYLNGKLVAGSKIVLTENNDAGNETLTISLQNTGTSYSKAFTNADLIVGILTITHNLSNKYCIVQIFDNSDIMILPDTITLIDTSSLTIDLTSYGVITGTWNVIVVINSVLNTTIGSILESQVFN